MCIIIFVHIHTFMSVYNICNVYVFVVGNSHRCYFSRFWICLNIFNDFWLHLKIIFSFADNSCFSCMCYSDVLFFSQSLMYFLVLELIFLCSTASLKVFLLVLVQLLTLDHCYQTTLSNLTLTLRTFTLTELYRTKSCVRKILVFAEISHFMLSRKIYD